MSRKASENSFQSIEMKILSLRMKWHFTFHEEEHLTPNMVNILTKNINQEFNMRQRERERERERERDQQF